MLRALLYLRLMSAWNWLRARGRSLRQPKQLAGALMFALYFWFFFLRHWGDASRGRSSRAAAEHALGAAQVEVALPADFAAAVGSFGVLSLLVIMTLMWIVPTQRAALGFTEAEIAFLFPAPIGRRALVHFRLLSAQARSLVGATIMMLISNQWRFLGGSAVTHALGWWFVFSALSLHYSGANFTLTRLSDRGLGTARRRALVATLISLILAVTVWQMPSGARLPEADVQSMLGPAVDWVVMLAATAPLSGLLWPLRQVLGPFLAADTPAFLIALAPALLVILLHYLWVVRSAIAFEDATIEQAEKRSARVAAWRSGQRRFGDVPAKSRAGPFALSGTGQPELAFLWKNLLSAWPYFNLRVFSGCTALIITGGTWLLLQPAWHGLLPVVAFTAAMTGAYMLVIGPQFARQDIRSDLSHADILKTYPLPGWRIVLGEILTPAAILTGLVWLSLLIVTLTFHPRGLGSGEITLGLRLVCAGWLAVLTPVLVILQLLVPNAAALVFPAWFHASRTRGGGPEVAGQRMIFLFAQLLTMAAALLPAVAFAGLLIFVLTPFVGAALAVSLAALSVLVLLVGEAWCGLWLLGQRFEKLDLSAELRS